MVQRDDLTGTASAVVTALSELDTDPTSFDVTLDAGTASAANIASIYGTTGIGTLDGSAVTTLTGTASAVVGALSDQCRSNEFRRYPGGDHSVGDLKSINDATDGSITVGNSALDLTGSAADVADALDGITNYSGNVVLTSAHSLGDLITINAATGGSITTSGSVNLTGSGSQLVAALSGFGTDGYSGNIAITGSASIEQIDFIGDKTNGTLSIASSIGLSGTAAALATTVPGISSYSGTVTITDNHDLNELRTINNASLGSVFSLMTRLS